MKITVPCFNIRWTYGRTHGHRDLQTNSVQRAEWVKIKKILFLVSSMSSEGRKKGDRVLIEGETNCLGKQEMELALYLSGQRKGKKEKGKEYIGEGAGA